MKTNLGGIHPPINDPGRVVLVGLRVGHMKIDMRHDRSRLHVGVASGF